MWFYEVLHYLSYSDIAILHLVSRVFYSRISNVRRSIYFWQRYFLERKIPYQTLGTDALAYELALALQENYTAIDSVTDILALALRSEYRHLVSEYASILMLNQGIESALMTVGLALKYPLSYIVDGIQVLRGSILRNTRYNKSIPSRKIHNNPSSKHARIYNVLASLRHYNKMIVVESVDFNGKIRIARCATSMYDTVTPYEFWRFYELCDNIYKRYSSASSLVQELLSVKELDVNTVFDLYHDLWTTSKPDAIKALDTFVKYSYRSGIAFTMRSLSIMWRFAIIIMTIPVVLLPPAEKTALRESLDILKKTVGVMYLTNTDNEVTHDAHSLADAIRSYNP